VTMGRPDLSDAGAAFAIGALVGVGMVLLFSGAGEDRTARTVRLLRDNGVAARPASRSQVRDLRLIVSCIRRMNEVERS